MVGGPLFRIKKTPTEQGKQDQFNPGLARLRRGKRDRQARLASRCLEGAVKPNGVPIGCANGGEPSLHPSILWADLCQSLLDEL